MGMFSHSTIFVQIAVFMIFTSMVGGKISGKIDLAIITPASHARRYMELFKQSLAKLPELADIADNKVRVVVFDCITKKGTKVKDADPLFALSGDKAAFDAFVNNWNPTLWDRKTWYHHDIALNKLRKEVFNFNDVTRAKVVIMIVNGIAVDRNGTREAARKLREKGVYIYVIFHREKMERGFSLREEIKESVSHKDGVVSVNSSKLEDLYRQGLEHVEKLENVLARDLCTGCLIVDNGSCNPGKRPVSSKLDFYGDNNAQCQTVDPTPNLKCPKERCESECDYEWPWSEECNKPCKIVSRNPQQPPPNGMENCPPTRMCPCPTTTGPSTTAPTTPATLASTTDSEVVPISDATPSDKSSTTPSTNSTGDPGAGGPAPDSESGSSGLSLGAIIGIVIGVLVLVAFVSGVLYLCVDWTHRRPADTTASRKRVAKAPVTKK